MKQKLDNSINIEHQLKERILIMDGAMGTCIQSYNLAGHNGNNDILNITHPQLIADIHQSYINAGADIIETNTFNSNIISQDQYQTANLAYDMAFEGARIARETALKCARKVWVAGSIGPTAVSLSLLQDKMDNDSHNAYYNTLSSYYEQQADALIKGGADLLLLETVFDKLNAKSALIGINNAQLKNSSKLPIMVSATINKNGKTFTGQTPEEIYSAISNFKLLSFGLNCSFGADSFKPYIQKLSSLVTCAVCVYPNAGLPNAKGEYEETPAYTSSRIKEMAQNGLINIAGGCCGTTPEHIAAIARNLLGMKPRIMAKNNV